MKEAGRTHAQIATIGGCTKLTSIRWWCRYKQTGSGKDLPQAGRPKLASPAVKRAIAKKMSDPSTNSVRKLAASIKADPGGELSPATVSRRLKEEGAQSRVRTKKPNLTDRQRAARRSCCRDRRSKSYSWRKVMWSDEKSIPLYFEHRREWVFDGDSPSNRRTSKFTPSLRVCAGFSYWGRTPLVRIPKKMNAEEYISMLRDNMLPSAIEMFDGHVKPWVSQHDGDGTHTAKKTRLWLDSNTPDWIRDWPSNSPDMHLLANGWGRLMLGPGRCKVHHDGGIVGSCAEGME